MSASFLRQQRHCEHATTISAISTGVERIVCEDCGYVGFRYELHSSGEIDRAQFARDADRRGQHAKIY